MKKEFFKKAYEILKDNEGGIIFSLTEEEKKGIEELIEIDTYNTENELRILRNYLVLAISRDFKEDYSNAKENRMLLAVVTNMIDNKIFKLGGQV